MSKSYYANLAVTNIQKNSKIYLPYVLMNIIIIGMFYIMHSIAYDPGLEKMSGGSSLKPILYFGIYVVGIFSAMTVFYTNSFIMKRRRKEIGVYNILGMGKSHIARMMSLETLFIAIGCLSVGIGAGILFSKLMYMVFLKLLGFPISFTLSISVASMSFTLLLFAGIFLGTMVLNLAHIHLANPIELVTGTAAGEREPKTKWLMTLIGVVSLGAGYWIAVTVKTPLQAIALFFVAVILVMIGTYALFTTGSIVLLKSLRANKKFYYQMKNFTVVSGMLYRMKQNAVGLANICILSTMVIISLTTTISMYAGLDDMLINRYPAEVVISSSNSKEGDLQELIDLANKTAGETDVEVADLKSEYFAVLFADVSENGFVVQEEGYYGTETNLFQMIAWSDYVQNEGNKEGLTIPREGEAILYCNRGPYGANELILGGAKIGISKELDTYNNNTGMADRLVKTFYMIVKDEAEIKNLYEKASGKTLPGLDLSVAFDLKGSDGEKTQFAKAYSQSLKTSPVEAYMESRSSSKAEFCMIYGGFLFLGLFLGAIFLVATVMIMYYKQISEGYDDQQRYETMQKVGMSHHEIKTAIKSQTVLVFFMPLVAAVIHVAFAFNVVNRLLAVFSFTNTPLFIACTALTSLVFGLFYYIIYRMTVGAYFKIVSWTP